MKTIRVVAFVLVLLLAMSAVADTVTTFNVTLNWNTGTTTFGTFALRKTPTTISLDSWSIDTPQVGVFDTLNSLVTLNENVCGAFNPCFALRFSLKEPTPENPALMLSFAGSARDFTGGPILAQDGSLTYVVCVDPCLYFLRNGSTSTPEPSTFVMLGAAGLGLLGRKVLRAAKPRRCPGSEIAV